MTNLSLRMCNNIFFESLITNIKQHTSQQASFLSTAADDAHYRCTEHQSGITTTLVLDEEGSNL
jgi:hypothetical protein